MTKDEFKDWIRSHTKYAGCITCWPLDLDRDLEVHVCNCGAVFNREDSPRNARG